MEEVGGGTTKLKAERAGLGGTGGLIVKDRHQSKEHTEGLCDGVKKSHSIAIPMTLIIR